MCGLCAAVCAQGGTCVCVQCVVHIRVCKRAACVCVHMCPSACACAVCLHPWVCMSAWARACDQAWLWGQRVKLGCVQRRLSLPTPLDRVMFTERWGWGRARWDSGGFGKCRAGLQDSGSLGLRRDQCGAMAGEWQGVLVAGLTQPFNDSNKNFLRAYSAQSQGVGVWKKKIERPSPHYVRH